MATRGYQIMTLYRQVLRLHRQKLPAVQRSVGDEYAKKEFRAHQVLPADSTFHDPFVNAWEDYCVELERFRPLEGAKGWSKENIREQVVLGRDLAQSELDSFSDEQKAQLGLLKTKTQDAKDKLFNES
jgi:hypothetical protein